MSGGITIRVCDFETTGMAPPPADEIMQAGYTDLQINEYEDTRDPPFILDPVQWFVNPGKPCPPDARACHHISDDDVATAMTPREAKMRLLESIGERDLFAAHNAAFDSQFFHGYGHEWICTYKCAKRAWPLLPAYGNQFLRYHFNLISDLDDRAMPPHRAGPDSFVTAHILAKLLEEHPVETLVYWTKLPIHYPVFPIGKHKGKAWSEVEKGMLEWVMKQPDMDADIKANTQAELDRRSGKTPRLL